MHNDFKAKTSVVYDCRTVDRSDASIVRFFTPILKGEPEGAANERLQRLDAGKPAKATSVCAGVRKVPIYDKNKVPN